MSVLDWVAMVRCRLDGAEAGASALRYVPLAEFGLWRHLMETRHRRRVVTEVVSVWVPEEATLWNSGFSADELEPVLRLRFEQPGPGGVPVPVERFFPAETYPQAQEALLSHFNAGSCPRRLSATPGYFVSGESRHRLTAVA